jgi:hypothetical protein
MRILRLYTYIITKIKYYFEKLHLQEQALEQEHELEQEQGLFHGVSWASTVEERHIVLGD